MVASNAYWSKLEYDQRAETTGKTMTDSVAACELCAQTGGEVLHHGDKLRVVLIDDALYPGFCRVIWNGHAREMTDLAPDDRALLMDTVWLVEAALREAMSPDKVNLASLGNMTPHVHWHVIPRFADDAHFPGSTWGPLQRTTPASVLDGRAALVPALRAAIARHLVRLQTN
jgi:diadenosine tetraphosphate (Ap4A) HIT family hydrolase